MNDSPAVRLAVQEAINGYAVYYDSGRLDRLADLFAADAVFDIMPAPPFFEVPLRGRRSIREAFAARYRVVSATGGRRHVCSNTIFEQIGEEECRTSTFLTVLATFPSGPPKVIGSGVYEDVLRAEDGRWRFTERRLRVDGSLDAPGSGNDEKGKSRNGE